MYFIIYIFIDDVRVLWWYSDDADLMVWWQPHVDVSCIANIIEKPAASIFR
jgi:hypothetical protein